MKNLSIKPTFRHWPSPLAFFSFFHDQQIPIIYIIPIILIYLLVNCNKCEKDMA